VLSLRSKCVFTLIRPCFKAISLIYEILYQSTFTGPLALYRAIILGKGLVAIFFSALLTALDLLHLNLALAALQLGSKQSPELHDPDKFVLCQVPCYPEGEDLVRWTIDSFASLDKQELIVIICDGNIMGSGIERTTPRTVPDNLGVDPQLDPDPVSKSQICIQTEWHDGAKSIVP